MDHKVLIVDDEPIIASTLEAILRSVGYEAKTAYSAERALALIAEWQPACAIVDVVLPGLNGVEFGKLLRAQLPECRLLLISGQTCTAELLEAAQREGYQFEIIAKPVHPTVLLDRITELLTRRPEHAVESPAEQSENLAAHQAVIKSEFLVVPQ